MASFMANFFPGGKQEKNDTRPSTPINTRNNFTTPASTPQGSPSKKTIPPGANELPVAFDNMKIHPHSVLESPIKLGRPQTAIVTPLSPGKSNIRTPDGGSPSVDESVIHKNPSSAAGSPLKNRGQENTPPVLSRDPPPELSFQPSPAAVSRQELYQQRERPSPTVRRFNTSRGLTAEELEILKKPSVKRLVNVTQLCRFIYLLIYQTYSSLSFHFILTTCQIFSTTTSIFSHM